MDVDYRKMSKDSTQVRSQRLLECFDERFGCLTKGALVVAVLDQRYLRVLPARDVVRGAYSDHQSRGYPALQNLASF
jgi:hypothetical protein